MNKRYRFTVYDVFGDPIRYFNNKSDAVKFVRNKPDCLIKEVTLIELLGECLV